MHKSVSTASADLGQIDAATQDSRDPPSDIVIALVKKSKSTGIEVRLRDLHPLGKAVLLRLVKQDSSGTWRPAADGSRCGITLRPSVLSRVIDALEKSEDVLDDAGLLP